MEALACKIGSITVGSSSVNNDKTLDEIRPLAEDFFGYTKQLSQIKAQLKNDLDKIDEEFENRSEYAKGLAKMPHLGELNALENSYERGLESYSHGESFLVLFQSRIKPGELYLLDEPEAPLSSFRQLGFIALLKQMINENSQFIIATHSPIIMAFPDAEIYSFDILPIQKVNYDDLEHVTLTKSFLQNPQSF